MLSEVRKRAAARCCISFRVCLGSSDAISNRVLQLAAAAAVASRSLHKRGPLAKQNIAIRPIQSLVAVDMYFKWRHHAVLQ